MCDHCGCRTPIAALMGEHDRLRELAGLIRSAVRWEQELSRPGAEGVRS